MQSVFRIAATLAILVSFPVGLVQNAQAAKPPKVDWTPARVENGDIVGGMISVEVTADQDITGATLSASFSLNGLIGLPAAPFDLLADIPTIVDLTVLVTPDEAGHTIGGTIHLIAGGKHLAKPLAVSLKKTETEDEEEEPEPEESEAEADDAQQGRFISWSDGTDPLGSVGLDLFEGGAAQIVLTPRVDLADVMLWLTPSLRDCISAVISPANVPQVGVLEISPEGDVQLVLADTDILVDLTLLVAPEDIKGCGGTLHLRNIGTPRRTWSSPLNVQLGAGDEEEEEVAPTAVVDAASFEQEPIAPGQILSIFGSGLGPAQLTVFDLDENGEVGEGLGDTMVFFDGVPARVLSTSSNQVNVISPQELSGTEVELLVVVGGKQSTPFPVALQPLAPELFTLAGSGDGQAAAFNQDGSLNRSSNPAAQGSIVILFGTGAGPTNPPVADGELATGAFPLDNAVQVFVGGVEAQVLYAGTSPGQVGALTQFNIQLGAGTPSGQQPVTVVVGGASSGAGATLAVE